ncbi:hypothetical protein E8E11_008723 [Didymella keratinophila]|nr:hypothetical protein E8E11_008723 [Didymella keratinophila]
MPKALYRTDSAPDEPDDLLSPDTSGKGADPETTTSAATQSPRRIDAGTASTTAYETQEARKAQQLREAEARLRAENYARQRELSQSEAGNWVTYICEDCEEKVRLRRNDAIAQLKAR